jgi:hypothetical protein
MIKISRIDDFDKLSSIENDWNKLALAYGNGWPMVSCVWVRSYLEHMLESKESWSCLAATEDNLLVGIFPIIECSKEGAANLNSDFRLPLLSDLLMRKGKEKEILPLFFTALSEIKAHWRKFTINGMREDSPFSLLDTQRKRTIHAVSDGDGFGSFNPIEGEYGKFYDSLGSNHRRNLKKAHRKLAKLRSPVYRFLEGKDADPSYLEAFMRLEASGYKSAQSETGTAIINSPQRVLFKTALTKRLFDLGWLQWHILEAEGKIIAMQMAFMMGSVLTLYKICYDEKLSDCAPGKLLAGKMFERAHQYGKISEINWITDLPFHDFWKAQKRPYFTYHLYPRGFVPYIRHYLPRKIWLAVRDTKFPGRALTKLRKAIKG